MVTRVTSPAGRDAPPASPPRGALPARPAYAAPPLALAGVLRHWAAATPDAPFLTFEDLGGTRVRWTYGAFYAAVARTAAGLAELGVRPGERCVIHTGNTPGFLTAFWALQELGATAVPTIAQYAADELGFVLRDCEARVVITTPELMDVVREAAAGLNCTLVVDGRAVAGAPSLSELERDSGPTAHTADPDGAAVVLYTSGTTSRPKGVVLSHRAALYTAQSYAEHFRLQPGDVTLTCLPLFHVNGLLLQMTPVVLAGGALVLTPRFSASRYWGWVHEHAVTVAHLVAGPIRLLLADEHAAGAHGLRLMSFGMPLTTGELTAFESRFGIPLVMIWGSTETGCGGTLMPLDVGHRPEYQNVGLTMRGWELAVVEPDTNPAVPVADGETGELIVRSPGVMTGYLHQLEATAETMRDGWVHTGDLGWRDAEGYVHFVDRLKDMLKPSGENVAAGEIERVLLEHPAVGACGVVGVPDPIRMERVVAFVVAVPGMSADPDALIAWCAGRLAPFKVPSQVEVRAALPVTSIGKVRKAELRAELLAREETA
jgi:crotonobetaine/carnitine-CoA ligase